MPDSVLLRDSRDVMQNYQQAKAVEAQQAIRDLLNYCDEEEYPETHKVAEQALAKVNQLVGTTLAPRLVVRAPAEQPQPDLPTGAGGTTPSREVLQAVRDLAPRAGSGIDSVTLSAGGKEVTLTPDTRAQANRALLADTDKLVKDMKLRRGDGSLAAGSAK